MFKKRTFAVWTTRDVDLSLSTRDISFRRSHRLGGISGRCTGNGGNE